MTTKSTYVSWLSVFAAAVLSSVYYSSANNQFQGFNLAAPVMAQSTPSPFGPLRGFRLGMSKVEAYQRAQEIFAPWPVRIFPDTFRGKVDNNKILVELLDGPVGSNSVQDCLAQAETKKSRRLRGYARKDCRTSIGRSSQQITLIFDPDDSLKRMIFSASYLDSSMGYNLKAANVSHQTFTQLLAKNLGIGFQARVRTFVSRGELLTQVDRWSSKTPYEPCNCNIVVDPISKNIKLEPVPRRSPNDLKF